MLFLGGRGHQRGFLGKGTQFVRRSLACVCENPHATSRWFSKLTGERLHKQVRGGKNKQTKIPQDDKCAN